MDLIRRLTSWLCALVGHDWRRIEVQWLHRTDLPNVFDKCFRCGLTSDGRFED